MTSSWTQYPYTEAQLSEMLPHTAAIASFRALLPPLLSLYPSSYPLHQALHCDRACYRWLKARSFSPSSALSMLKEALAYRAQHSLDTILTTPFPLAIPLRRLSHDSWHHTDLTGHPIFIERFGHADLPSLTALATPSERLHYHHFVSEYVQRILLPSASARAGHLVDSITSIFDMHGFSRATITTANYQHVSSTIKVAALLYPELMSACYIINAPWVFSMGWGMVKGMIDEQTRAKIAIVSGDMSAVKGVEGRIRLDKVPAGLGGTCRCGGGGKAVSGEDDGCGGCMWDSEEGRRFEEWVRAHEGVGEDRQASRKGSDSLGEMEREYSSHERRLSQSSTMHTTLIQSSA